MTYAEIVRHYFPDATDDEVEFILWERTAYPCAGEETLRSQLQELATAWAAGLDRCTCGREFRPPSNGVLGECDPCHETLHAERPRQLTMTEPRPRPHQETR